MQDVIRCQRCLALFKGKVLDHPICPRCGHNKLTGYNKDGNEEWNVHSFIVLDEVGEMSERLWEQYKDMEEKNLDDED